MRVPGRKWRIENDAEAGKITPVSDRTKLLLEAIRDWPPAEIEELVKDLQRRLQPEPSAAYKEWIKTAAGAGLTGPELDWKNPHASKEEVAAWLIASKGIGIPGVTTESIMRETREG